MPGGKNSRFLAKANPTAIISGTTVDALPLVGESTLYHRASVKALKPGATALHIPVANTGTVWICSGLEVLTGAFPLSPGGGMELPPDGDLANFYLACNTAADGVLIIYN